MRPPLNRISRSVSLLRKSLDTRRPGSRSIEISALEPRVFLAAHSPVHPHVHHTHVPAIHATVGAGKKPTTTTTLATPSSLTAGLSSATSVQLKWTDNCTTASGYYVLRSTDGGSFSTLATINSSSAVNYGDTSVGGGHTYTYEVEAYGGGKTTSASNKASVTTTATAPTVPTGLSAAPAGSWINLAWNGVSSASGYYVLRSTDGTNFSQIAQLTSGSTVSDLDASVSAGQVYYYEVEAYNSVGASPLSNVVSITAPSAQSTGGVAITTRFSDELVITASGADDSISLTESGSTLDILADGQSYAEPVPAAGVFIYTRGGNDGIDIDKSVTALTTLETIDGAPTAIVSAGTNVSAWIDSTDSYSGTGTVHRVSSFAGGVSKALGASLPNPTDSGTTTAVNLSLWGTGPVAGDVNQGEAADCYFLASLAAFAGVKPSVLTQSAVDMGDGTYTVQFESGSTPVFVRVSNQMPVGPFAGFMYAYPGANNTMWAMVLEKAFCYFRTGANTYASINSGLMGEAYSDLGVNSSYFAPGAYTDSSFYSMMSNNLNNGEAVTFATFSSAPNLVSSHAYTLVSVYNLNGVNYYVVRNPWGTSGDSLENSQGYATLTFAQLTANFTLCYQAVG